MTTKTTKILHKRGLEQDLPQLEVSEIGFTTDTEKLFVGGANGNVGIASLNELVPIKKIADEAKSASEEAVKSALIGKEIIVEALKKSGANISTDDSFEDISKKITEHSAPKENISFSSMVPSTDAKVINSAVRQDWFVDSGGLITEEAAFALDGGMYAMVTGPERKVVKRADSGKEQWSIALTYPGSCIKTNSITGEIFYNHFELLVRRKSDGTLISSTYNGNNSINSIDIDEENRQVVKTSFDSTVVYSAADDVTYMSSKVIWSESCVCGTLPGNGNTFQYLSGSTLYRKDFSKNSVWSINVGQSTRWCCTNKKTGNSFVLTTKGEIIKISNEGRIMWRKRAFGINKDSSTFVESKCSCDKNGNVLVHSYPSGGIKLINSEDGTVIWSSAAFGGEIRGASINPENGSVYVASSEEGFYRMTPTVIYDKYDIKN